MSSSNSRNSSSYSPFDYAKSILNGSKSLPVKDGYSPFMVNRAVAHHRDALFHCQMLNEINPTDEQHYEFLFNAIPKYKRTFEKWVKSEKEGEESSDIMIIALYFQCSLEVAHQYAALMSDSDILSLRAAYGGKSTNK